MPVLVPNKMQDLLIIGHGAHTWNTHTEELVLADGVRKAPNLQTK